MIINHMVGLRDVIIEVFNRKRAELNPALVFVSAVVYFALCPAEAKPNEPGRKFENVRCNDEDKRSLNICVLAYIVWHNQVYQYSSEDLEMIIFWFRLNSNFSDHCSISENHCETFVCQKWCYLMQLERMERWNRAKASTRIQHYIQLLISLLQNQTLYVLWIPRFFKNVRINDQDLDIIMFPSKTEFMKASWEKV